MIYKTIPDYQNYIINEDGVVFNTQTNKQLATQLNTRGYKTVNLWKNNKLKKHLLHRLVALIFIPNPNNLPCVNHIDRNKLNNNVTNLEWCSYSYNSQHSLHDMCVARASVSFKIPVKQLINNTWYYYNSINEAHKQTGISINTIRTSLRKMYKNPKYIWEYVNNEDNVANYPEHNGYGSLIKRPEWLACIKVVAER